ncbi:MAG TPA: PQQ-binding-like beta-propeller repeat protein [Planctomycetaceae bacterium]|nr:PQQ-binding-like beta-propeller repeat protein [Planctomycetaceae bacterium]
MSRSCRWLTGLLALCALTNAGFAQEWTRFRGPNGAGQSDAAGIPTEWTETDYAWKVALPGIGHSSPVIWGDQVFVTSADQKSGERYLVCVNANTGDVVWKKPFAGSTYQHHKQNALASSTPAVDEKHIYSAWAGPEEYVVIAHSHAGDEVWRKDLGPYISRHGFASSPIVHEGLVIITNDQEGSGSSVVAFDAANGKVKWTTPHKTLSGQNASYATPIVYEPKSGPEQLIVFSWAHGMQSLDPKSGKSNWEDAVFPKRPVGSPIIVKDLLIGNCGDGGGDNTVVALDIPARKNAKPKVEYTLGKSTAPYVPTLVAAGDLVFLWGDKGIVTCIDAPSGKQHWRERVGGNYSGSPIRVQDRIYCMSAEGECVVLAASDKFQVLARNPLGEGSRATPAVADGRMFLRTESHLLAIGKGK